jgi:hypothetical protein
VIIAGSEREYHGLMQRVRWGVLAVAKIATGKVIPAMQRGELSEVVGIASRDRTKAELAARALGIPKAYGSHAEMLADRGLRPVHDSGRSVFARGTAGGRAAGSTGGFAAQYGSDRGRIPICQDGPMGRAGSRPASGETLGCTSSLTRRFERERKRRGNQI